MNGKEELEITLSVLAESLETQLNRQGYTLGDMAETYQTALLDLQHLNLYKFLTDTERRTIMRRLDKRIRTSVVALDETK